MAAGWLANVDSFVISLLIQKLTSYLMSLKQKLFSLSQFLFKLFPLEVLSRISCFSFLRLSENVQPLCGKRKVTWVKIRPLKSIKTILERKGNCWSQNWKCVRILCHSGSVCPAQCSTRPACLWRIRRVHLKALKI